MLPSDLASAYLLPWLALAGGMLVLTVRRRQAPLAAGLAIPVLGVMAVFMAVPILFFLGGGLPEPLFWAVVAAYPWVQSGGWVLLVVAVMAGRRPRRRHVH